MNAAQKRFSAFRSAITVSQRINTQYISKKIYNVIHLSFLKNSYDIIYDIIYDIHKICFPMGCDWESSSVIS